VSASAIRSRPSPLASLLMGLVLVLVANAAFRLFPLILSAISGIQSAAEPVAKAVVQPPIISRGETLKERFFPSSPVPSPDSSTITVRVVRCNGCQPSLEKRPSGEVVFNNPYTNPEDAFGFPREPQRAHSEDQFTAMVINRAAGYLTVADACMRWYESACSPLTKRKCALNETFGKFCEQHVHPWDRKELF
jgi:hypothetical protein